MRNRDEGKGHIYQTLNSKKIHGRQNHLVHWPDELSVAVLIDGEHNSFKLIGFMQPQAERLGALRFQRVYGNWSSNALHGWQSILVSHRLEPRHQRQVAASKNATDIALAVDAMRLYTQGFRKFCIVASDSDYTPLIEFLCSEGCLVMVIGNVTTPSALQDACSVFVELPAPQRQALVHTHASSEKKASAQVGSPSKDLSRSLAVEVLPKKIPNEHLKAWLLKELTSYEPSPHAWVQVPGFRDHLVQHNVTFKPKTYGYKNILVMLQAFPELFQLRPYKNQVGIHEVRRVKSKE